MFKFSSKVKYSSLILLLAVVVMFYSTALPFSAAVEPTEQYLPVTIDIDELAYLITEYSTSDQFMFIFNSADGVLYNDANSSGTVFTDSSFQGFYSVDYCISDSVNDWVLIIPDVDVVEAFTVEDFEELQVGCQLNLPFDFVIGPESFFQFGVYFQSGLLTVQSIGALFGSSDVPAYSFLPSSSYFHVLTDDVLMDKYLADTVSSSILESRDYCVYEFMLQSGLSEGEYLIPGDVLDSEGFSADRLTFVGVLYSNTSYVTELSMNEIWSPAMIFRPFTIYVLEEIYPVVEDYLGAITNPSPESKAEVERLEQELEEISEQLREDASDLEVEKPDISDSVEDLPSEVVDGMDEVGQTVLSPLMTLDLIATLFSVLFGVVALKLILFGSGTS